MSESTSYHKASWFSFLTFGWLNPLVETGVERQVAPSDLPELSEAEDTAANARRLSAALDAQERSGRSHPLLRAVVDVFWYPLMILQALRVVEWSLALMNPLLLQRVLVFQEAQDHHDDPALTSEQVSTGISAACAFIMLGLVCLFYGSQLNFFQARVDLRINSALRGAVLERSLKIRTCDARMGVAGSSAAEETSRPSVYNIISFDVGSNIDVIWIILGLWIFPFQFISVMVLLFHQVQWAVVPGLVVIVFVKAICAILLVRDGYLRDIQLKAKDRRLGLCEEGFTNVRTLQMLAWTQPFLDNMMVARSAEIRATRDRLWMQKMVAAADYSLTALVSLAILAYYVIHDGEELKASVALPVIVLVSSLVGPFSAFPMWANRYLIWRSAYDRVNKYLGLRGDECGPGDGPPGAGPLPAAAASGAAAALRPGPVAELQDCSLAWQRGGAAGDRASEGAVGTPLLDETTEAVVKGMNLQVWASELLVICGAPSQGKSSLLLGLLGELAVLEGGELRSPAVRAGEVVALLPENIAQARAEAAGSSTADGALPFASQTAALFSGTIRSNILFGARHDAGLYTEVIKACALEADLLTFPLGDGTEVAQGGATLSGGQRARLGLARAAYRAALQMMDHPGRSPPLVLLDDPMSALDHRVAKEIVSALFAPHRGLLCRCAVVVSTADAWWLSTVVRRGASAGAYEGGVRVAVLREGGIVALGSVDEVLREGLAELDSLSAAMDAGNDSDDDAGHSNHMPSNLLPPPVKVSNPQDMEEPEENEHVPSQATVMGKKIVEACTQTPLTPRQSKAAGQLVDYESRHEGRVMWETYLTYLVAVGPGMMTVMCASLTSIMVFQNCCTLWIAYWTSDNRETMFLHPLFKGLSTRPDGSLHSHEMLEIYACLVAGFTISNFAGHALEIVGGVRAARSLFSEALVGTMTRPFRWWDSNPTGRVLNRFSEDVDVMDKAVTNMVGIIFGAALYFVGHSLVLAVSNPVTLAMLPFVAMGMEFYARYYRSTIRELQRIYLISVSSVYQDMVEAITGRVTIRAFGSSRFVLCSTIAALDNLQRAAFTKQTLNMWIGLRMSLVGYCLNTYAKLQPIFQYMGYMGPQSAAMVGFSIQYSSDIVGIIQQFIMNYSELEMQLISIERLREYGAGAEPEQLATAAGAGGFFNPGSRSGGGLIITNLEVTYRAGLRPALSGVMLSFAASEAAAVVGRTGAGKTSLLLAIMQLVPYTGQITVGGWKLSDLTPRDVRSNLVSVVPQQPVLFQGSLRFNLDPEGRHTDLQLRDALVAVGLRSVCGAITSTESRLMLSQGEQQLLSAARALLRRPRVVLLDEVTACLPAEVAKGTLEALLARFKEASATVLVVTHQENLLKCCDRIVRVSAGRVVSDERVVA